MLALGGCLHFLSINFLSYTVIFFLFLILIFSFFVMFSLLTVFFVTLSLSLHLFHDISHSPDPRYQYWGQFGHILMDQLPLK